MALITSTKHKQQESIRGGCSLLVLYCHDSDSYSAFVAPNGVAVRPSLFTRLGTAVSCHPMRTYSGAET